MYKKFETYTGKGGAIYKKVTNEIDWIRTIITWVFILLVCTFLIYLIKINIDSYKSISPPLTPGQQERQWEDYYDYKHGPRG